MASTFTITAKAEDKISGPFASASKAVQEAAQKIAAGEHLVAEASDRTVSALGSRVGASKEVQLAMARQRAAGDPLQAQIVALRERHVRLTAEMRGLAKAGREIPPALAQEAVEAERTANSLDKQTDATTDAIASGAHLTTIATGVARGLSLVVGAAQRAAQAVWGTVTAAADAGDQFFVLSDRLGVSARFLSQLGFAARQNNVEVTELQDALQSLAKTAVDGGEGFKKWGLSVLDSGGRVKDTKALFLEAAETIAKLTTNTQQTAAAQDLFGGSGVKLLPILRQGEAGIRAFADRADELGISISDADTVIANQFNNRLGELQDALSGVSREVGSIFLPVFTEAFEASSNEVARLRREIDLDDEAMRSLTANGVATLLDGLAGLIEAGEGVVNFFATWGAALNRVGSALSFVAGQAARMLGGTTVSLIETGVAAKGLSDAFDGVGEAASNTDRLADSARRLADDLRRLAAVPDATASFGVLAAGAESLAESFGVLIPAEEAAARAAAAEAGARRSTIGAIEAQKAALAGLRAEAVQTAREMAALGLGEAAAFKAKEAAKADETRRASREIASLVAGEAEVFKSKQAEQAEASRLAAADHARDWSNATRRVVESISERTAAYQRAADEAVALDRQQVQSSAEAASSIRGAFAGAYSAIVSVGTSAFRDIGKEVDGQTKTWGKAFKLFGAGLAEVFLKAAADFVVAKGIEWAAQKLTTTKILVAKAAEAAGGQQAAHAHIPYVGVAIGAAAAAAIFAAVMAFAGKFHEGGMVRGPAGRDNLVAFVEDGEYILPRHVVQDIQQGRGPGTPGAFASGGIVSRDTVGAGGGNVTLNVSLNRTVRGDRSDLRREINDVIVPELRRLIASGALDIRV